MKKFLILLIIGCISYPALAGSIYAQGNGDVVAFTNSKIFIKSVQAFAGLGSLPFLDSVNTSDLSKVSYGAIKDFKGRYTMASGEKWFAINGGFMAYFSQDGYNNRAYYDKKGRWQCSLTYYSEDKLPREIRAIVKSTYYDFTITVVEDVQTRVNGVYLIYLEDKTSIKIVRVTRDGDMDVFKEITKS